MNVEIRTLEETLVNVLNSSRLPTEVKRLVVAEVETKLGEQANKDIAQELQAIKEQSEKGE